MRILIIDNDNEVAQRSAASLRERLEAPVELETVVSLGQGIRALLEYPFDLVILELGVNGAAGIVSLSGIRGAAPEVPVVVYSRGLDELTAIRALKAGAQECLAKEETSAVELARAAQFAVERQRRLSYLDADRVEAAHRATHDTLTGLANRELFLEELERALIQGQRHGRRTAILFIDLDGFKAVNDVHGHGHGDTLLRIVAGRLMECMRRSDLVARLGGDEFVVLLPEVNSRRDVQQVRETILAHLRVPVTLTEGLQVSVGGSIGTAMSPRDGVTAVQLLEVADAEMYRDKQGRRLARAAAVAHEEDAPVAHEEDPPVAHEEAAPIAEGPSATAAHEEAAPEAKRPSALAGSTTRPRDEQRLHEAVAAQEFEVHFQPIVDLRAHRACAAEALLRWRDPLAGLRLPEAFVPLAEDSGLIISLGETVMRRVCEAVTRWRVEFPGHPVHVAVNLSPVEVAAPGFVRRVADILQQTGCPAEALTLEVSEECLRQDPVGAADTLGALKALGLRLVVDDFGMGHGTLTMLRDVPVDGIKLDRRLVSRIDGSGRDAAIVAAAIQMARALELEIIAEGVETAEQARRLNALACHVQQGNYFGLPLAPTEADSLWRAVHALPIDSGGLHGRANRDASAQELRSVPQ
ncbi:MAG: EAL domain-containing protein [Gemmatimonadaceae bacterium]